MPGKYLNPRDNYETPIWAVKELVKSLDLTDTKIWCPFHGNNGQMIRILKEMNLDVVSSEDLDFFDDDNIPKEWDILIDNPPFSMMQRIVPRALSFKKPVILILPLLNQRTKWLKETTLANSIHFTTAMPSKRINYDLDGKHTKHATQETAWFCWNTEDLWWGNKGVIFL